MGCVPALNEMPLGVVAALFCPWRAARAAATDAVLLQAMLTFSGTRAHSIVPLDRVEVTEGRLKMSSREAVTLQEALDAVEALPDHLQEDLINIIRRRGLERRRDLLADNIREARAEYSKGEVSRGSVDKLMRELAE